MSWWQPLVILLELYLLAALLPWLAVSALSWSLRRSFRSRASVVGYLDKLQQAFEAQRAFWPTQPRFGPYEAPAAAADTELAALEAQLQTAQTLAEPVRTAPLPYCGLAGALALRCWSEAWRAMRLWRGVRGVAGALEEAAAVYDRLRAAQQTVLDIPSDTRAQLALRQYEIDQAAEHLQRERAAGTVGLDAYESAVTTLRGQIARLQAELDGAGGQEQDVLEKAVEPIAALQQGIARLRDDLHSLSGLREQAETRAAYMDDTLVTLGERWRAIQRRRFREQDIDEVLLGLNALREDVRARLAKRTREAYREVNALAGTFEERTRLLADDLAGLEQAISASDDLLNTAADELTAARATLAEMQAKYINIDPDQTRSLLDDAAANLAAASDTRQQGTRSSLAACDTQTTFVRGQAAEAVERVSALEERVQAVNALWTQLNQGDLSSWRKQVQFASDKLQAYPRHLPAVSELLRNIELSLREAELAVSYLPQEMTRNNYYIESQMDDAFEALQYARRGIEYVTEGIGRLRSVLETIESQRLQLEQDVAMLLYVDLPAVEQLSAAMLVDLREKLTQLALNIRQEAAQMLDPAQTEYDEALRYKLPYLKRQLDEVRAAHATHIKQLQLQYDAEKTQLARSWARLDHLDLSQLAVVQPLVQRIKAEYAAWQKDAEASLQNPYALNQVLGRRSADLDQRLTALHRDIVEGRLALKELDKAYRQRYALAEASRDRLRALADASPWPNLPWDIDAQAAWNRVSEAYGRIEAADSLQALLDAWQRALGAVTELNRLYERGEAQAHDGLGHLQKEWKHVTALKQRAQHQAEELTRKGDHAGSRKLTRLVAQTEHLITLSRKETQFDAALRHLCQARDNLLRL